MAILHRQRPTLFDKLGTSYYCFNVEVQAECPTQSDIMTVHEVKNCEFFFLACWLFVNIYVTNILYMQLIVHTPCHYCEMVAGATGNKISKCLELA